MKSLQAKFLLLIFVFQYGFTFSQIPENAEIKFISIDPITEEYTVAWYPSPSTDITELELKYITRITPGSSGENTYTAMSMETFSSNSENQLVFSLIDYPPINRSFEAPMKLAIEAVNTYGSTNSLADYHQMTMASSQITTCPNQITLNWTPYRGNNISIVSQTVYKINGSTTEPIDNVGAGATSHTVDLSNENGETCYFIETRFNDAFNNVQTSRSRKTCQTVDIQKGPDYIIPFYIENIEDTSFVIKFLVDTVTDYDKLILARSIHPDSAFVFVDSIGITDRIIETTDSPEAIDSIQYFYKLYAENECGDIADSSLIISSVTLEVEGDTDYQSNLLWHDYPTMPGNYYYVISRETNSEAELIDSVEGTYFYRDNNRDVANNSGTFCYQVIVKRENDTLFRKISNKQCVTYESRVFIPNAINPWSKNKENRIFKPVCSFIEMKDFKFIVYNRWGHTIYETDDPQKHWDGTFKDEECQQGTYTYFVQYYDSNGKLQERRGTVNLLFDGED